MPSTAAEFQRCCPRRAVQRRTQGRRWPSSRNGEAQMVVNVAVLTEGWDHPPTDCVVLLRPSSLQVHLNPDDRPWSAHRRSQRVSRGSPRPTASSWISAPARCFTARLEQDVNLDGPSLGEAPRRNVPNVVPGARGDPRSARSAATVGNAPKPKEKSSCPTSSCRRSTYSSAHRSAGATCSVTTVR